MRGRFCVWRPRATRRPDLTGLLRPTNERMSALLEAPAAPAATTTATKADAEGNPGAWNVPSSADGTSNLTGRALTSALSLAARHRRGGPAEAKGTTAPPKPGPAPEPAAAAPATAQAQGTDNSNSTSAPETPDAEGTPTDPAASVQSLAEATEEGDSETADQDGETPPAEAKGVKSLQKRVDKLTARLKRYEEQFGKLDGQAPTAPEPAATPASPTEHPDITRLDREMAEYQAHIDWMDANPEGGEYRDAQGRLLGRIDPDKIPAMKREAERRVAELTARRAYRMEQVTDEARRQTAQADQEAVSRYPWLNDPESAEHQQAQALLSELPRNVVKELGSLPKARLLLGALVEGMKATKAPKAAPAPRPVPPKVMAPAASAAPVSSPLNRLQTQLAEAEAEFEKSGSVKDQQRVLKLRRQIRMGG